MSQYSILDASKHRHIRIDTGRGEQYGENVNTIPIIADELRSIAIEYPVCILKDPNTGQFGLYALTGLEAKENLFLSEQDWCANYVPMHIRRQPFMISVAADVNESENSQNTVLSIQMSHPKVVTEGGEALFDENGDATNYLHQMSSLVSRLGQGIQGTQTFINELVSDGLVEQLNFKFTLANGTQHSFEGFYGINETKLAALDGERLQIFHRKGYLQACHLILSSIGHLQTLINKKNTKQRKQQ